MESLAFLPLVLVFIGAIVVFALELFKKVDLARAVFLVVVFALFLLGIRYFETSLLSPIVSQASGWKAPFGISFYIDSLSAGMIVVSSMVVFLSVLCGSQTQPQSFVYQHSLSLILLLLLGVVGAYTTSDLFNLYVWFEVFLTASFGILIFSSASRNAVGITKYIVINIIGSTIFLVGLSLLYSSLGTLNMAGISLAIKEQHNIGPHFVFAAVSILFAFMIKAGLAPLYGWLPFSYPHLPGALGAVFSALLTKVGVFCLFRLEMMGVLSRFQSLGLSLCLISVVIGILMALSQKNIFSILSHNIVTSIGFISVGIFIGSKLSLAASIFYLFYHIVAMSNLFLIESVRESTQNSDSKFLKVAFLISAGSLAGIPPLAGFWAKLYLLISTLKMSNSEILKWLIVFGIVMVSILTLLLMLRLWNESFGEPRAKNRLQLIPIFSISIMVLWTIGLSLGGDSVSYYTNKMAAQLQDRDAFINLVLVHPEGDQ